MNSRIHRGTTITCPFCKINFVTASGLDWTVVRPPGLTDEPGTGYATADTWVHGAYCARDDLATMLLDQLDDQQHLRRVAAVSTPRPEGPDAADRPS